MPPVDRHAADVSVMPSATGVLVLWEEGEFLEFLSASRARAFADSLESPAEGETAAREARLPDSERRLLHQSHRALAAKLRHAARESELLLRDKKEP